MSKIRFFMFIFLFFAVINASIFAYAEENVILSKGQTIYVPAYSHIYIGDRKRPFFLTVTVSIRNIDMKQLIKITTVDYYETKGNLLTKFVETPVTLKPLESISYVIAENDKAGGSGANFRP